MFHLIPDNLAQVSEKLAWLQANGYENSTRTSVINDMTKDGVQDMLDTALEGPYWGTGWEKVGQVLAITGATGETVAKVYPRKGFDSFEADLENNDILYWRNLSTQVGTAIGND
ncbi:MAG: hypothetical protein HDT50_01260 [Lactobacillus sp.]|nr:hypothetical protein [Lactobacillus sp.]